MVNASICNPENAVRQPHQTQYSPARQDPLKQAAIANASLRLHLRRFRREVAGARQLATANRLLDVTDAFGRALEWLRGGPGAADDNLVDLEHLAIDSRTVPSAAEVVAQ